MDLRELMSQTKFYSDYSRYIEEEDRYETWGDSVERVMNMHKEKYADELKSSEALQKLFDEIEEGYKEKLFLGAQRALQFGGDQLLKNNARLYNCTATYSDRVDFFGEFMWFLLSGAGVGVSVQFRHVNKLPKMVKPSGPYKTYRIADSIEGWADAKQVLVSSFFEPSENNKFSDWSGKNIHFVYDDIRDKGSFISGGFKAPGPEPLRIAIDKIRLLLNKIVNDRGAGTYIKPIEVYDVCMFSADAVISGGVRRSATIFIFSPEDDDMMNAKTGDWFIAQPQRKRSNNSALLLRGETTFEKFSDIMKRTKEFGEPGFVWADDPDALFNPCVEIGLYAYLDDERTVSGFQGCNLSEINGEACTTEELFYLACKLASAIATLQAGYTNFPYLSDVTKKLFEREALLGVSITGWMNNPKILFDPEILRNGAKIVKDTNKAVAKMIGINPAARTCCTKPSGNASVILKTASGIHAEKGRTLIRYNTYMHDSDIAKVIMKTNPDMVEEGHGQSNSYVIGFPYTNNPDAIIQSDLSAIEFLEKVAFAYRNWVEYGTDIDLCVNDKIRHNISNTVTVGIDEWEDVTKYIFDNRHNFSGISLMGAFGDRDYFQAPFTEVKLHDEIVEEHGAGAIFSSGLIVDADKGFRNLWEACYISIHTDENSLVGDVGDLQKRWVRRFRKFADQFFDGDYVKASLCLKDVHIFYRYEKIRRNFKEVDFANDLGAKEYVDINRLAASACAGGVCEIEF